MTGVKTSGQLAAWWYQDETMVRPGRSGQCGRGWSVLSCGAAAADTCTQRDVQGCPNCGCSRCSSTIHGYATCLCGRLNWENSAFVQYIVHHTLACDSCSLATLNTPDQQHWHMASSLYSLDSLTHRLHTKQPPLWSKHRHLPALAAKPLLPLPCE